MTTYYKVLRPVTPADLDTRPRFVEVLKLIPSQGHVTSELFRHLGKSRASKGITHACSRGILKRISPHDQILGLNSVKFWLTQLNESGHKNSISKNGTKSLYLQGLSKFDAVCQPFDATPISAFATFMQNLQTIQDLCKSCHPGGLWVRSL